MSLNRLRAAKDAAATQAFRREAAEGPRAHALASLSARDLAERLEAPRWRAPFRAIYGA